MATAAETPPSRRTQRGRAELELARRAGRTRLTHSRTRPPLQVQQALYPDGALPDMAFVFLANPTGGLLDGDRQEISVAVHSGAKAHITTQSAAKIYAMPRGGQAEQRIALDVAAGGYLEYLPDPLIPYRDAALNQTISINLEPGAALLTWEVITPGRTAMGEAFRYRRISSRLTVTRRGKNPPAYREAFDLTPADGNLMEPGLLGPADIPHPSSGTPSGAGGQSPSGLSHAGPVLGSMLILCEPDAAHSILERLPESRSTSGGAYAAASLLPDSAGAGVKAIGPDTEAVQSTLSRAWAAARQEVLDAPPPFLRKY